MTRHFLYNILKEICPTVKKQGTITIGEYPERFITYWNFDNSEPVAYDNKKLKNVSGWWIYFYSTDPEDVDVTGLEIKDALEANGFVIDGNPTDIPVDVSTHTGCFLTAYYEEFIQGGNKNESSRI